MACSTTIPDEALNGGTDNREILRQKVADFLSENLLLMSLLLGEAQVMILQSHETGDVKGLNIDGAIWNPAARELEARGFKMLETWSGGGVIYINKNHSCFY